MQKKKCDVQIKILTWYAFCFLLALSSWVALVCFPFLWKIPSISSWSCLCSLRKSFSCWQSLDAWLTLEAWEKKACAFGSLVGLQLLLTVVPPNTQVEGPLGYGLPCGVGLAGRLQSKIAGWTPGDHFQPTRRQLIPVKRVSDGPLQTWFVFNSFWLVM